ncbi:MAG: HRDC domain-containing protein [Dialister invisus]
MARRTRSALRRILRCHLEDMVSRLPQTEEEMAEVHGIGAFKLKKYGERFLRRLENSAERKK